VSREATREVPQNLGPDRFSRFDIYWIQTNIQTSKVYIHHRVDEKDVW